MNIPPRDHPSRGDRRKDPVKGFYSGTYERDGSSLIRTSDGLKIVTGDRGPNHDPHLSRFYLVDKTPGRGYLSSLYGSEFDDKAYRYRIVERDNDPGTVDVVALYPLKRGKDRGARRRV